MEADWVGSSPAIAPDLNLLFIGLEFGLFKKRGGVAAINMETGEKVWEYSMPEFTHGSPAYSKKYGVVVIGSNDGVAYAFRAKDGKLIWNIKTGGPIKASPAFDDKRGSVAFGSFDGNAYIARVSDGKIINTIPTGTDIYSTPLVHGDRMYVASLDKKIYCVNLDTFNTEWSFLTWKSLLRRSSQTVRFSSAQTTADSTSSTGNRKTKAFSGDRTIVNAVAYNEDTKDFFVPTSQTN